MREKGAIVWNGCEERGRLNVGTVEDLFVHVADAANGRLDEGIEVFSPTAVGAAVATGSHEWIQQQPQQHPR